MLGKIQSTGSDVIANAKDEKAQQILRGVRAMLKIIDIDFMPRTNVLFRHTQIQNLYIVQSRWETVNNESIPLKDHIFIIGFSFDNTAYEFTVNKSEL